MSYRVLPLLVSLFVSACAAEAPFEPSGKFAEVDATTILDAPAPKPGRYAPADRDRVLRGEYLVELLACGACHTDGALIGEPVASRALAGSQVGIAFSNPLGDDRPGILFAPNITPDLDTGVGEWSDQQIINAIRAGAGRHVDRRIAVMPWPGYAKITMDDAEAIVAYLRSIDPVRHRVPDPVAPGRKTTRQFVYFGVYRSR
jgi:mono/diheme cytochrome c family protein